MISAIEKWLGIRGKKDGPLFFRLDKGGKHRQLRLSGTGLYSLVKELGLRVGIKNLSVHKFRHSSITACAQVVAENNLGIETLTKFSRHSNLKTTLIYFDHLEDKQKKLSDLVAKKVG